MKAAIKKQSRKYKKTFGLLPEFKAGIHLGEVTTGEIGVIKRDITFSGDVLNTTARIQGLCNQYEVDILVSDELLRAIADSDGDIRCINAEGQVLGRFEPELTHEELEEIRRRLASSQPRYTTDQMLARLRSTASPSS